ncbi:MAG: hypothetical protein ACXABG_09405 [Promethearchaeota archaeon]|jgi:hypothetical protein
MITIKGKIPPSHQGNGYYYFMSLLFLVGGGLSIVYGGIQLYIYGLSWGQLGGFLFFGLARDLMALITILIGVVIFILQKTRTRPKFMSRLTWSNIILNNVVILGFYPLELLYVNTSTTAWSRRELGVESLLETHLLGGVILIGYWVLVLIGFLNLRRRRKVQK